MVARLTVSDEHRAAVLSHQPVDVLHAQLGTLDHPSARALPEPPHPRADDVTAGAGSWRAVQDPPPVAPTSPPSGPGVFGGDAMAAVAATLK